MGACHQSMLGFSPVWKTEFGPVRKTEFGPVRRLRAWEGKHGTSVVVVVVRDWSVWEVIDSLVCCAPACALIWNIHKPIDRLANMTSERRTDGRTDKR